jgi:hypothetical protein
MSDGSQRAGPSRRSPRRQTPCGDLARFEQLYYSCVKKCVKHRQSVTCAALLWEATTARHKTPRAILPRSAPVIPRTIRLLRRPRVKLLCKGTKQNVECRRASPPERRVLAACQNVRSRALLTEQEVARSWSRIFNSGTIEPASFDRAEQLLDELRAESPLRHRLTKELEELRNLQSRRAKVPARA